MSTQQEASPGFNSWAHCEWNSLGTRCGVYFILTLLHCIWHTLIWRFSFLIFHYTIQMFSKLHQLLKLFYCAVQRPEGLNRLNSLPLKWTRLRKPIFGKSRIWGWGQREGDIVSQPCILPAFEGILLVAFCSIGIIVCQLINAYEIKTFGCWHECKSGTQPSYTTVRGNVLSNCLPV